MKTFWKGFTIQDAVGAFPMAQQVKNLSVMQETQDTGVRSLDGEDSLKEERATNASILAWKISWAEEPGDIIKNICDLWEELKTSSLTGVWKKLIPNLLDDFEAFKTSLEEITAGVVETAREQEMEPENVTDFAAIS